MDKPFENSSALVEKTITVLVFIALIYALFQTLSAFLGIFTFAIIFAVPFRSIFEKLAHVLGGKRKLAALIYGGVLVALVAVPLIFFISALAEQAKHALALMHNIKEHRVPALPSWLAGLPLVGEKISEFWAALEADPEKTLSLYEPKIRNVLETLISAGGGIVSTSLEVIIGIILSSVLLYNGSSSVAPLRAFFTKLLGPDPSAMLLDASEKAINGVAIGVMGTAVLEALAGWVGFRIAGLDLATGLAAVLFLMAVVQLGPVLVLLPVILWKFSQGETGWGIFMIVWLVLLIVVDNVVKPVLIGKSGKMPTLVLFLGVIGGLSAWGFTGMFKGAVVLAITYTIFNRWTNPLSPSS